MSVTSMSGMFSSASAFDQNICGWAVDSVTSMSGMFSSASAFDQDIGDWAVDSVTSMSYMFSSASAFNQDLGWCVDAEVNVDDAFGSTSCTVTDCGTQGNCPITGYAMTDSNIRTAVTA